MENNTAIKFDNVSKKFRKGKKLLLKEALIDTFKPERQEDFWALKDIIFEVKKGESIGVIGTNGSGKSTILKLIAGVLTPTKGKITVNGHISPLIELGAGFHPELTGRENIYLNGTILGLSKKEVDEKLNDIIAFSELEEFIDTPVKHYSSGMYMRLGFSVAIHTKPDILLIDEILAVGDVAFQTKCLNKMEEFKKSGVTIFIVSHNMEMIKKFCHKAIMLSAGKVTFNGDCAQALEEYEKNLQK
ncbi:MAG: ABC transporter ATP-binding protein [Patescibacteria group bacterium]|nr:ABC transporter ATP-binding protein [Patescibacteria group bacterium]